MRVVPSIITRCNDSKGLAGSKNQGAENPAPRGCENGHFEKCSLQFQGFKLFWQAMGIVRKIQVPEFIDHEFQTRAVM